MTKRVGTDEFMTAQMGKAMEALKQAGIDPKQERNFMTVTQLANGYVFLFGAETRSNKKTMIVTVAPGIVMPLEDVELDIFEADDEEEMK